MSMICLWEKQWYVRKWQDCSQAVGHGCRLIEMFISCEWICMVAYSHATLLGGLNFLPCGPLHRVVSWLGCWLLLDKESKRDYKQECKMKVTVLLYSVILETTFYYFSHILFIRSKSINVALSQVEEISERHECYKQGSLSTSWAAYHRYP